MVFSNMAPVPLLSGSKMLLRIRDLTTKTDERDDSRSRKTCGVSANKTSICLHDQMAREVLFYKQLEKRYFCGTEGAIDLDEERVDQQRGKYKRQDLLKMHAYRDAIRRTDGAYVLYPGDANQDWRVFTELLPGLGAIALRPSASSKSTTDKFLETFLRDLALHVSDSRTQRSKVRHQVRQTYDGLEIEHE